MCSSYFGVFILVVVICNGTFVVLADDLQQQIMIPIADVQNGKVALPTGLYRRCVHLHPIDLETMETFGFKEIVLVDSHAPKLTNYHDYIHVTQDPIIQRSQAFIQLYDEYLPFFDNLTTEDRTGNVYIVDPYTCQVQVDGTVYMSAGILQEKYHTIKRTLDALKEIIKIQESKEFEAAYRLVHRHITLSEVIKKETGIHFYDTLYVNGTTNNQIAKHYFRTVHKLFDLLSHDPTTYPYTE